MVQHVMKFLPLVLTTFLSMTMPASASQSHPRTAHKGIAKRMAGDLNILSDLKLFTGTRWTFYDAGIGACGVTNQDKDFIVALNAIQYGVGYPGPQCFKKITMEYNDKKATAMIMDMCPECPYGGLDLSRGLFKFFAPEDVGVIYGQWHFGEDNGTSRREGNHDEEKSPPASTKTQSKSTSTRAIVHAPPPSPMIKLPRPGVAHPNHTLISEATRLPRPLSLPEQQRPSEMDAILPSSAKTPVIAARPPNGEFIPNKGVPALASTHTAILKTATSSNTGPMLKYIPLKSEHYDSDDESEYSENLAALHTVFSRLGSIAAAGSTSNRDG